MDSSTQISLRKAEREILEAALSARRTELFNQLLLPYQVEQSVKPLVEEILNINKQILGLTPEEELTTLVSKLCTDLDGKTADDFKANTDLYDKLSSKLQIEIELRRRLKVKQKLGSIIFYSICAVLVVLMLATTL